VFGFKEINFNELPRDRLEAYIAFVRRLFPNAAIVFNTREVEDVKRSGWWRRIVRDGLSDQLKRFRDIARDYVRAHAGFAIHVEYDKLVQKDRVEVARLLAFLRETLSDDQIEAVFSESYSYDTKTLTGYLSGRAAHVELRHPEWWRAHVDELQVQPRRIGGGYLLVGAIVPAVGSDARIFLELPDERVEVCGDSESPRVAAAFATNPAAANAAFSIKVPDCDSVDLVAVTPDATEVVIGSLFPMRGLPAWPTTKAPV